MLKTKAIIAALIYTFSSLGLLVHVHFCCGGVAGISVISELTPCSCDHHDHECGGGEDCCDFESFYLDTGEDHKTPAPIEIQLTEQISNVSFATVLDDSWVDEDDFISIEPRAGPPEGLPAKYIELCTLVLYS